MSSFIRWMRLATGLLLAIQVGVSAAVGAETGKELMVPGFATGLPSRVQASITPNKPQISARNLGSYTLAPLVQDNQSAYYLLDTQAATTDSFDGQWQSAGINAYSTPNSTLQVYDYAFPMEAPGTWHIMVQISAFSEREEFTPWVLENHADKGLTSWRLDVGTGLGGNDPISPALPFRVLSAGAYVNDSMGQPFPGPILHEDTSDSTGLSGTVVITANEGVNIAGEDLNTIIMYWDIEYLPDDSGFDVTPGLSGAWYDPSHDGEGFVLHILNNNEAVVYWFTYEPGGRQRWMVGTGDIIGSRVYFDPLYTTSGGVFGPGFNPENVNYTTWGTLELAFTSCDSATATYSGPANFGAGSLNLQRLSRIWGENCDGSNSAPQSAENGIGYLNPGFTGSWYNPSRDGEGFTVEILDEETALIYWFTYDTQGNQVWMFSVARIGFHTILAEDVLITSGGQFGPDFNPDKISIRHWGEATFDFASCETGSVSYLPPPDFGPASTPGDLHRLSSIHELDCSFLFGR